MINVTEPNINAPSGSIYGDVLTTDYTPVDATQSLRTSSYVTANLSRIYTSKINGSNSLQMSTNERDAGYVTTKKLISSLDLIATRGQVGTTRNRKTESLQMTTNLRTTKGYSSLPSVKIRTVASALSTDQAPETSIIYPPTDASYTTQNSTTSQNNSHKKKPMAGQIFSYALLVLAVFCGLLLIVHIFYVMVSAGMSTIFMINI